MISISIPKATDAEGMNAVHRIATHRVRIYT